MFDHKHVYVSLLKHKCLKVKHVSVSCFYSVAEAQAANDSARYSSRSALLCVFHSDYRPYFVRLAPFACRVLVHIS